MSVTVGTLFMNVRASFDYTMELAAGRNGVDRPVLRIKVIRDRREACGVNMYDAVFFQVTSHRKCNILDAAESVAERGASILAVCRDEYIKCEMEQLATLCDEFSLPLVVIDRVENMPLAVNLFYQESINAARYYEGADNAIESVIRSPENYELYSQILTGCGFYERSEYVVGVVQFVSRDGSGVCSPFIGAAADVIRRTALRVLMNVSAFCEGNQIIVVFSDATEDEALSAMRSGIESLPEDISSGFEIYAGMSRKKQGVRELAGLYRAASGAAAVQMSSGVERRVAAVSDSPLSEYIVSVGDRKAAEEYYMTVIARIDEHDKRNNSEYMKLLRTYFRNNCSQFKTSEQLFMHKNSVQYALQRIIEILGRDELDINLRLELFFALKLCDIYHFDRREQSGLS